MPKCLVITTRNVETNSGRKIHVFHDPPVSIGSAPDNTIRIDDPRVAAHQGLLFFTTLSIKYRDCSRGIDDPPAIVSLPSGIEFQIGPIEITSRLDEAVVDDNPHADRTSLAFFIGEINRVFKSIALTALAVSSENMLPMLDVAVRATQVLGVLADVAAEVRWGTPAAPPIDVDPLRPAPALCSLQVTDYLLDPESPVMKIVDLRRYLVGLARREVLTFLSAGGYSPSAPP